MYNKNAEIFSNGNKIGELTCVRIEDMFDDGLAYMCDTYVKAICNNVEKKFLLVPDIDLYLKQYLKKLDDDETLKVHEYCTDRNDYMFYEIRICNEENETEEIRYIASFLAGSKRRFGSANFRTIKDAVAYIKSGKEANTENMIWTDNEGKKYSIDELYNLPTTSILFSMTLDCYNIFDRNEECVFSRVK